MLEVIEKAAGCCDENIHATSKRVLLWSHSDAADDWPSSYRRVSRQRVELFDDLHSKLARRRQNECARFAARLSEKSIENREKKCRGLSTSCRSARKNVAAFECGGNCVGLDWSGPNETEILQA